MESTTHIKTFFIAVYRFAILMNQIRRGGGGEAKL